MSDKFASLEVIAPSVEEAVAKGLAELGLAQDAVEVEVLDSGSRGLFGLGFRQARVRLTIKPAQVEPAVDSRLLESLPGDLAATPAPENPPGQPVAPPAQPEPLPAREPGETDALLQVARETVEELLAKMNVEAQVTARFAEPEDAGDRTPVWVDVRGEDLSVLIGPKSETLAALQYIAGLIVGKEVGRAAPIVVDVEGYRARRVQQIRQLARRMAEQAVRTGRRQVLEPMPANERRLVHIELRDHPDVTTESIGEEPKRKVTIIPRR